MRFGRRFSITLLLGCLVVQSVFARQQSQEIFRWNAGNLMDRNILSEKMYQKGVLVKMLNAQGVNVWAAMAVNGKRLEVLLLVGNEGAQSVDVLPSTIQVQNTAKSKYFKPVPVEKVARDIEKKAQSAAGWAMAGAWFFLRNRTVSNSNTQGSAYGNATVIGPGGAATLNANGGYSESTTTTTTTPNRQAQQWAYERGQNRIDQARIQANTLRQYAFLASTISQRSIAAGLLFFECDKNAAEVLIRVPVGSRVYEIPFRDFEISK